MKWISTKIRFPESGKQVLTACRNKNIEDGIWLYDLCYYYSDTGWEDRDNWEDVLYWTYIDKPEEKLTMAHFIDKSDLVAEIDRQKIGYNVDGKHSVEYDTTRKILNIIDTLEVKEVDLDKEMKNTINEYYNECEKKLQEMNDNDTDMSFLQLDKFAKHFFELGLKTQKGE